MATTTGGTPYDRLQRGRLPPIGKECFVGNLLEDYLKYPIY
jgi:hypothetical protein